MATNRTWYSEVNRVNDDSTTASLSGKSLLWQLKALLKGDVSGALQGHTGARPNSSKWDVYASSNGTTAAIDSTDRWGTTFSAANMVRAAAGVARSIITLRTPATFPGGPYYLTMDYRDSTDSSGVFSWSKNPPTAITTTAITQPADTVTMNASTFVFHDATATPWKAHLCVDAAGAFYLTWGKSSSGAVCGFLGFVNVDSPTTGVLRPVVGVSEYATTVTTTVPTDGISGAATSLKCSAHSWNNATFHSATSGDVGLGVIRLSTASSIQSLGIQTLGPSPIDGKIFGYPVPVIFNVSPNYYQHGIMPDMLHVGKPIAQGGLDPASGNADHQQVGCFRLPYNAAMTF